MTTEYEIVDRSECPPPYHSKWKALFENLPVDKAVKFTYTTKEKAISQGKSIRICLRKARTNIRTHYRIVPDGDSWLLFVWKE